MVSVLMPRNILLLGGRLLAIFSSLILTLTAPLTRAEPPHPLEFVTENFPPLNFTKDGKADGYCSELVRELLKRTGQQAELTVLPWARAYRMAQTDENVGLYCTVRNAERENLFQWVGPVANLVSAFYARKDSNLQLEKFSDAKKARTVIALRDGYSAQLLKQFDFKNLTPVTNNVEGVRVLIATGDQSLLLISSMTVPATLDTLSLPHDAIKLISVAVRTQAYIAFSHKTNPALVNTFQHALNGMKRDGSFAALYKKWFSDAPPGMEREADINPTPNS